jgi:hypothetical protein
VPWHPPPRDGRARAVGRCVPAAARCICSGVSTPRPMARVVAVRYACRRRIRQSAARKRERSKRKTLLKKQWSADLKQGVDLAVGGSASAAAVRSMQRPFNDLELAATPLFARERTRCAYCGADRHFSENCPSNRSKSGSGWGRSTVDDCVDSPCCAAPMCALCILATPICVCFSPVPCIRHGATLQFQEAVPRPSHF